METNTNYLVNYYQYKYVKYLTKYNNLAQVGGHNLNTDLDKIVSIASKVKILAMCEATHGQEKINKFRVDVFKVLVEKCGYTVFVLEDQYSCCQMINNYIKTGYGSPLELVMQLMFFWTSKQMLKLIKWMRQYNKKHNNILEFKGIDIQTTCDAYDAYDRVNKYNAKKDKIPFMIEKIAQINDTIDQFDDDWVKADGFRDKSMYEVFMEFYDKDKKYFMIAHNFHFAKKDVKGGLPNAKWAGYYLNKRFGSDYYAIGNLFKKGKYLETPDLIETGVKYKWLKGSKNFIIVYDVPKFIGINSDELVPGLNILDKGAPYDAVMVIDNETPLELAKLY